MRITISGMPGSGKTTVAKVLSEKLRLKHYHIGAMRRDIARQRGITLNELNKIGESDPSTDKVVDDYLINLGKTEDNFIAEGRTASYFIPNSVKIFIAVDVRVGAERIMKDAIEKGKAQERNEKVASSIDEQAKLLQERIDSDKLRYKRYYGSTMFERKRYTCGSTPQT
ncbi:cytidylate kinase family protein [archaeon]|nr:cytidylate kinase family protein [archaeon]